MKNDKFIEELSKCVRCGSCKAFCPTFGEEGIEALGTRGRLILLREVAAGRLEPTPALIDRVFSCILCGACAARCPLGIDIDEVMYHGRGILKKTDRSRRYLRRLLSWSARWPELGFRMLRLGQNSLLPLLERKGLIPMKVEFPEFALKKKEQVFKVSNKKGRVAIFAGCSVNYVFPSLGESLINVLRNFGYEVVLPAGEVCCGTPLRTLGLEQEARQLAEKNLRVFEKLQVDAIVSLCPTCTMMIRNEYPKFAGRGLEKAMDVSLFLSGMIDQAGSIARTGTYHDPCHLRYGLGIRQEPREIIRKAGIDLVEPEEEGCCGFGGTFCFSFRELSAGLLQKRTKAFMNTAADMVITSCPGCMLQLSQTMTDRPVLHLIEVIEEAYCLRGSARERKGQYQEVS